MAEHTAYTIPLDFQDLFQVVEDSVRSEWGSQAFEEMDPRIQRSLLSEGILIRATMDPDPLSHFTDAGARDFINEGWAWAKDRSGAHG